MVRRPSTSSRQRPGVDPLEVRDLLSGLGAVDAWLPAPPAWVEVWRQAPPRAGFDAPAVVVDAGWARQDDGAVPAFPDHHIRAESATEPPSALFLSREPEARAERVLLAAPAAAPPGRPAAAPTALSPPLAPSPSPPAPPSPTAPGGAVAGHPVTPATPALGRVSSRVNDPALHPVPARPPAQAAAAVAGPPGGPVGAAEVADGPVVGVAPDAGAGTGTGAAASPDAAADAMPPAAQGSDLLANFLPADGGPLGVAVDRFLDQLHDLGAPLPSFDDPTGMTFWPAAWAAAAVSLEVGRRWLRRETEEDPAEPARVIGPGGELAGWPGSWSARVP
jgi:hypothetical protein